MCKFLWTSSFIIDCIHISVSHIFLWRELIFAWGKNWQHFFVQQSFVDTRRIYPSPNMQSYRRCFPTQDTQRKSYMRKPLPRHIVANKTNYVCLCRWSWFHKLIPSWRTRWKGHWCKENLHINKTSIRSKEFKMHMPTSLTLWRYHNDILS